MNCFGEQPIFVIERNVEDSIKPELNFENKNSVEQRKLAHEDLRVAEVLSSACKSTDEKEQATKKAINRKAIQTTLEAVEHAQKSVTYADENHKFIKDPELRKKLQRTHNNNFMQKEHKKVGINIAEQNDIEKLNLAIDKKNGENSSYNAVRFTQQKIDDKSVDDAIKIAKKIISNLDKKVEESKKVNSLFDDIDLDNVRVKVDISEENEYIPKFLKTRRKLKNR